MQHHRRDWAGTRRRRAAVAAAGALTALSFLASATAPTAAAAAPPAHAPQSAQGYARQSAQGTAAQSAQASAAASRLGADLALPHAGRPEAVTHPAADAMAAGWTGASTTSASTASSSSPVSSNSVSSNPVSPSPVSSSARAGGSAAATLASAILTSAPSGVLGTDVSSFQPNPSWGAMAAAGQRFVYIKATEGTYYTSPAFASQYQGSYGSGFIRGAYTFAIPDNSSGAAQADYFVAHGGGWSADGQTLPGVLDIEFNPYGAECYGLTQQQMINWIYSFDTEYQRLVGRPPMIYTNTRWWDQCTGGSSIAASSPLIVANYGNSPYPLPGGWAIATIWQYTDSNAWGFDGDSFNGDLAQLQALALGTGTSSSQPSPSPSTSTSPSAPPATPAPAPAPTPSLSSLGILGPNTILQAGQELFSGNGAYSLRMQAADGNLVLYTSTGRPLWASNTAGHPGAWVIMQSDGNLVVYSPAHAPLWASNTSGNGPSRLVVQDDSNLVVYSVSRPTWATGT